MNRSSNAPIYVFLSMSIYIILRWAEHIARMEEGRSAFKMLTGKPVGGTIAQ